MTTAWPAGFSALASVTGSTEFLADDGTNNGFATAAQLLAYMVAQANTWSAKQSLSPTITGSSTTGALSYGTLPYADTGLFESFNLSTTGYAQSLWSNPNSGTGASTDLVVSNDLGTASTHYGNFGINSSTFTGTGSVNLANATYLISATGDLSIGSITANAVHFFANSAATDAITISSGNVPSIFGGAHTAITSLGIRSTGAAFDLSLASSEAITAGRTLSFVLNDANRTISLAGNLTTSGAFGLTLTTTGTTNVTLPTSGTLAILGANTFSATQTFSPAANAQAIIASGYSLTVSNAQALVDLSGTWNTTGVATALKLNITNTASGAGSLLMDLQIGGATRGKLDTSGILYLYGGIKVAPGGLLWLGSSSTALLFGMNTSSDNAGGAYDPAVGSFLTRSSGGFGFTSTAWANGSADTAMMRNAPGVVEFNSGTAGAYREIKVRSAIHSAVAVASLPASPTPGQVASVNNALAPVAGSAVTGGGAAYALVWWNNAQWTVVGV